MDIPNTREERVAAGDRRVRVVVGGTGEPAVFFDAALGTPLEEWALVAPEVARFARVVLWDRPGIGKSDVGPPLAGAPLYEAMVAVLQNVGARPVIAVGHSRGGLHALGLALSHPEVVAGAVLVESSHPDQHRRMAHGQQDDPLIRFAKRAARRPRWVRRGAGEMARVAGRAAAVPLGAGVRAMADLAPLVTDRLDALAAEHDATDAFDHARELFGDRAFPPVPLVVMTGTRNFSGSEDDQRTWRTLHAELARLSPRGRHIEVDSGHEMPFSHPGAIVTAIRDVHLSASEGDLDVGS